MNENPLDHSAPYQTQSKSIMQTDTKLRSIVKGVSYRLLATCATFSVTFLFTGDISTSVKVGLIDSVIKFIIYYLNERSWNRIRWGKIRQNEYQ